MSAGILDNAKLYIASLLLTRYERAINTKFVAEESFNQIPGSYEGKK